MKNLAIAAFLAVALAFVILMAGANARAEIVEGQKIACVKAFPHEDALSTVAVLDHSNNLYSLWFTMRDGSVVCMDRGSGVSWQLQVQWAKAHGGHVVSVVAPYTIIGGELAPPDTTS